MVVSYSLISDTRRLVLYETRWTGVKQQLFLTLRFKWCVFYFFYLLAFTVWSCEWGIWMINLSNFAGKVKVLSISQARKNFCCSKYRKIFFKMGRSIHCNISSTNVNDSVNLNSTSESAQSLAANPMLNHI